MHERIPQYDPGKIWKEVGEPEKKMNINISKKNRK